jgi:hypothetical protein
VREARQRRRRGASRGARLRRRRRRLESVKKVLTGTGPGRSVQQRSRRSATAPSGRPIRGVDGGRVRSRGLRGGTDLPRRPVFAEAGNFSVIKYKDGYFSHLLSISFGQVIKFGLPFNDSRVSI